MSRLTDKEIGGRISGRHGGAIVPGASGSLTCEGQIGYVLEGLPAGSSTQFTTAENLKKGGRLGEVDRSDLSEEEGMSVDEVRGVKRKINRSRVLEDSIGDSMEEEVPPSPREKHTKKRANKEGAAEEDSLQEGSGGLSLTLSQRSEWGRLQEKSSEDLALIANEWLDDLDILRAKSGNLQGVVSGKMRRIKGLAEVVNIFQRRSAATGDTLFLQKKNAELEAMLRASKAAEIRLSEDMKSAEGEMKRLRGEMRELRERMGSESPPHVNRKGMGTAIGENGAREPPRNPPQQDEETERLLESIAACDKRIDLLIELRKEGRKRIEEKAHGGPPPPTPRGQRRLLPRRKGQGSRGILSTETETEAASEVEKGMGIRGRPGKKGDWPLIERGSQNEENREEAWRRRRTRRDEGDFYRRGERTSQTPRRRPPPAAVTLKPREGITYAEMLREARQKLPPLNQMGITSPRIRETMNGGILIEIPGENGDKKADELVTQLTTVMEGKATVARPMAKAEALIIGIDQSVQVEDAIRELARIGDCRIGEMRTGPLRTTRNNKLLSTMWVQAPVKAVNKILDEPKIILGWSVVRAVPLKKRRIQCFKCWHVGHASAKCEALVDRTQCCFRCGKLGHAARECNAPPLCMVCTENKDRNPKHRMGTYGCVNYEGRDRDGGAERK